MAKGLHMFAGMNLRYGKLSSEGLPYRMISQSGDVLLPRGDFRITVFGAGGGGSYYNSKGSTQNTTGVFTGSFGASCGGRGGIVIFDFHSPRNGVVVSCTVGSGGTGKTSSASAKAGGLSKVVISEFGITATANGGSYGTVGTSVSSCKPGTGGTATITGTTARALVDKPVAVTGEIVDSHMNECAGRYFLSKLDYSGDAATDFFEVYYADSEETVYIIQRFVPMYDELDYPYFLCGQGGYGWVEVTELPGSKYMVGAGANDGLDGVIIIERL